MSRRGIVLTLTSFFLCSLLTVAAQSKQQNDKAREQARKKEEAGTVLKNWARDEGPYIIDPEENAAFKGLKTDEERENFIEQFWLRRDPSPDTIDTEFRAADYHRILLAHA